MEELQQCVPVARLGEGGENQYTEERSRGFGCRVVEELRGSWERYRRGSLDFGDRGNQGAPPSVASSGGSAPSACQSGRI